MDISAHGGDIPMPLSSSYGHHHAHIIHEVPPHHNHITPSAAVVAPPLSTNNGPIVSSTLDDNNININNNNNNNNNNISSYNKRAIRYRECLKNHAAAMGGNSIDGCGEFMPSGEDGTIEALKCSACNCHRNFHRKEIEGEATSCDCYHLTGGGRRVVGQKGVLIAAPGSEAAAFGYPTGALVPRPHPHQMIMSYNLSAGGLPAESDEQEGGGGTMSRGAPLVKKRFRTRFTPEQKDKMLSFAEKVGWRIQKQEEGVVQQFCQEIGIKRRVLKVWMHNNKHSLAKKASSTEN